MLLVAKIICYIFCLLRIILFMQDLHSQCKRKTCNNRH